MTQLDSTRLLILAGYVGARLADGQFERALVALLVGLSGIALCRWLVDPIIARKR